MNVSGVSAAGVYASSQQLQGIDPSKHGRRHGASLITDVDAQSSSVATAPSVTGKIGSKLNISV